MKKFIFYLPSENYSIDFLSNEINNKRVILKDCGKTIMIEAEYFGDFCEAIYKIGYYAGFKDAGY